MKLVLIIITLGVAGLALFCYFRPGKGRVLFNILRSPFDWLGEECQRIDNWNGDQIERISGDRSIRLGYIVGSIIFAGLTTLLILTSVYSIIAMLPAMGFQVNLDWLYERYPVSIIIGISMAILPIYFGIIVFDLLGKTHFIHWNISPQKRKIILAIAIVCFILSLILGGFLACLRGLIISEAHAAEEATQGEILTFDEQGILKEDIQTGTTQYSTFKSTRIGALVLLGLLELTAVALGFFSLWVVPQYIFSFVLKIITGVIMFIIRLPLYLIELIYNLFTPGQSQEEATSNIQQPTEITTIQQVDSSQHQNNSVETGHFDRTQKEETDHNKEKDELLPGLEKPLNSIKVLIPQLQHTKGAHCTEGILIEGPQQSGKTALLERLEKDFQNPLFLRASDFSGISDEDIKRRIIELSAETATQQDEPTLLLIDDIDLICGASREGGYMFQTARTFVNMLISLFDEPISMRGADRSENLLIIIATTRSVNSLPHELQSKFRERISLEVPGDDTRRRLIHLWLIPYLRISKEQEKRIVDNTQGYNYGALRSLFQKILHSATTKPLDEVISEALKNTTPAIGISNLEFLEPLPIEEIGGYSEIVSKLETLASRLRNRDEYEQRCVRLPRGLLFYGPPGTGKTYLARAFATLVGYRCIKVDSEKIGSPYIYQAERNLGEVFRIAQSYAPTLLLMDEFETLARKRGSSTSSDAYEGVVGVLLRYLDGLDTTGNIFVIGITNRREMIDEAVLRSGRIEEHIEVGLPDFETRRAIFDVHLRGKKLEKASDIDLDELSRLAERLNCADIAGMVDEAAANAIDEAIKSQGEPILTRGHLLESYKNVSVKKDEDLFL